MQIYITINKNSADDVLEHRICVQEHEHLCVLMVNTGATDVLVREFKTTPTEILLNRRHLNDMLISSDMYDFDKICLYL